MSGNVEIFRDGVGYSTDFACDGFIYERVGDGIDAIHRLKCGNSFRIKAGL